LCFWSCCPPRNPRGVASSTDCLVLSNYTGFGLNSKLLFGFPEELIAADCTNAHFEEFENHLLHYLFCARTYNSIVLKASTVKDWGISRAS